ncbi:MAG: hypothetical protein JWM95_183 [Gemmatimonadetes bacterium]|nr:hypothetical protein [Gemmatimonadota bacterium]
MKAPHRSTLFVGGFAVALAASAVPIVASAQRNVTRGPDTKMLLVSAFRGDAEGGVRAADEIRNRVQGEFSPKVVMPVNKKDIDNNLVNSGYRPDSALSPNDVKELAKIVRGDEIIDGTVQKNGTNYTVTARLFLPRDATATQPLGTFSSANLGDVARQVVDEYDKARKQFPKVQECENGLRANTIPVAIAAARAAIKEYPKATIARLCLATAYQAMKTTADSTGPWKDSVIAIAGQVLAIDKTNKIALTQQYDAYMAKADTTNGLTSLIGLMNADPTNSTLREQVIASLVNSGKPQIAIPITKQLMADNPGDPEYAKTYWSVLRVAKNYKESVPAGIAYVTMDTSKADTTYFFKQIQDLVADSSFAKAAEMAATASAKFPMNTDFLVSKAQYERRAGQLPAAKASLERALSINPKVKGANYILSQISSEMGNVDDAIKYAKADAAADPGNKTRAAQLLLAAGNAVYRAAEAAKSAEQYKKAIPILQASDEMSASPQAAFLIAVSAYQAMAGNLEALKVSKSCDDFKAANELLTLVSINMPRGAQASPESAKQIMGGAMQFQPFIDGSMKRFCK